MRNDNAMITHQKQVVVNLSVEVSDPDIKVIVKVERVIKPNLLVYKDRKPRSAVKMLEPMPVIEAVCEVVELDPADVLSKRREPRFVHARQMIFFILHKMKKYTMKEAGDSVGKRDHTTVGWALTGHGNDMKYVESYKEQFTKVLEKLKTTK